MTRTGREAGPVRLDAAAAAIADIYNAAWDVRHYCRPTQNALRAAAIRRLGLVVREAFSSCEEYAQLLYALCDALASTPDVRFSVSRDDRAAPGTQL